jgi:flagellar basal-body rod protein FlgC
MISALDVSTSALVAQRTRLNTISSNIANMTTVADEDGANKPYQPRFTVFQTDDSIVASGDAHGVKVKSVEIDESEPKLRYQPEHPLADERGYVAYPNINLNEQFVDALEATRSYEANIGVMEISKNLGRQTLSILA